MAEGHQYPRRVLAASIVALAMAAGAQAQQPTVRAERGGLAIGGSVSGSTINLVDPRLLASVESLTRQLESATRLSADHSEAQKKLRAELEAKLDLNDRQFRTALEIAGEKDVPRERLAAKLVEIAGRFKTLQGMAAAQPGDDAKVIALKAEAQNAVDAGELARADALLAEAETEQWRTLDRFAISAAETSARRGDIALARLRYREAAQHFAKAAGALPAEGVGRDQRTDYLLREAHALDRQGDEFGDNDTLAIAIARYRSLLNVVPRAREPLRWASILERSRRCVEVPW